MAKLKKLPTPITILIVITIIAALTTWLLPAGSYDKLSYADGVFTLTTPKSTISLPGTQHTLDSLKVLIPLAKFKSGDIRKPVAIPGTYHRQPKNSQGAIDVSQAPVRGLVDTADIIMFVLIIGGFMAVFQQTGAMDKALVYLSHQLQGREAWLIVGITFFFSFCGSSYGMAEETMVFYPILVPLYLAAGYDLLVPLAVIWAGVQLGSLSSFSNPFATIIASNAAGINWADGLLERIAVFAVTTGVTIWYIVRYAQKVKKDPTRSLVYKLDGAVASPYPPVQKTTDDIRLGAKNILLLCIFFGTIFTMIIGVIFFSWWMTEMTALYVVSAVLVALIVRMKERDFMHHFIIGAQSLLSVSFIIGVARGITLILNEGHVSDTILFYSANLVGHMSPIVFIVVLFVLYNLFTLFMPSSSGMAVLTMPIFGSLAAVVGVPGREIVNAYLFGMGIMGFVTPNGLMLPSLALANVSLKVWLKFIWPLLAILSGICIAFLVGGVL